MHTHTHTQQGLCQKKKKNGQMNNKEFPYIAYYLWSFGLKEGSKEIPNLVLALSLPHSLSLYYFPPYFLHRLVLDQ